MLNVSAQTDVEPDREEAAAMLARDARARLTDTVLNELVDAPGAASKVPLVAASNESS